MPGRLVFTLVFAVLAVLNAALGGGILIMKRPLLGGGVIALALVECATAMIIWHAESP